jgi:hypothetical protein
MKDTEEEHSSALMGTDMTGSGCVGSLKAKGELFMRMKTSMRDNGMKAKEMGTGFLQRETVIILKVIGSMIKEKVREATTSAKRINYLLVNGLMTNQNVGFIQKLKMKMHLH